MPASYAGTQVFNLSTGNVVDSNTGKITTPDTNLTFTVSSRSSCRTYEAAFFAFDGNLYSKYCDNTQPIVPNVITLHYQNAEVSPVQLILTSAGDSSIFQGRNVQSWRLYGSNNGSSWNLIKDNTYPWFLIPIDDVTNYEPVTFLDNNNYFSYLKFEVYETVASDADAVQFSELKINGDYRNLCPFKGNSANANNFIGSIKSNSPASTKSNGAGSCQNAVTR